MKKRCFKCIICLFLVISLILSLAVPLSAAKLMVLLGDADKSGKVELIDATLVQQNLANLKSGYSPYTEYAGDVDGNGKLESADATYIQRFYVGIDTPYQINKMIEVTEVDPVDWSNETPEYYISLYNQVTPKILTWIDDDTVNTAAIQSVMDIADELGIRCSFATITGNWSKAKVEKLKEAQNKGFHIFSHGHSSHKTWRTESLPILDDDLALSIRELQQNGFIDSDMIAYPGGVVGRKDIDITTIAQKWCRCGVKDSIAGEGKYLTGYGQGRYLINRKIIDKSTHPDASYYTDTLDSFSEDDAPWYLFATHSAQSDQFDPALVKAILQHALNTGWEIMPLNEAYEYRERYYWIQELFGLD